MKKQHIYIRRDDGPGGIHSQLHIPKVQPSDKGNYTCSAKNITPYTVRVYVTLGKIQIIKYLTHIFIHVPPRTMKIFKKWNKKQT